MVRPHSSLPLLTKETALQDALKLSPKDFAHRLFMQFYEPEIGPPAFKMTKSSVKFSLKEGVKKDYESVKENYIFLKSLRQPSMEKIRALNFALRPLNEKTKQDYVRWLEIMTDMGFGKQVDQLRETVRLNRFHETLLESNKNRIKLVKSRLQAPISSQELSSLMFDRQGRPPKLYGWKETRELDIESMSQQQLMDHLLDLSYDNQIYKALKFNTVGPKETQEFYSFLESRINLLRNTERQDEADLLRWIYSSNKELYKQFLPWLKKEKILRLEELKEQLRKQIAFEEGVFMLLERQKIQSSRRDDKP